MFAMTSVFSWQNSVSLFLASFHTPRPNLPVTPVISWPPTVLFQAPMMKRTSFLVLVLEGLVGHCRTIQLKLLQLGHRLELLWCWMVYLGNEQKSLSFLRLYPRTAFCTLLSTMGGYSISSKGFLPIHRKALNSLTWDIWFSLIHKNTFDAKILSPLLQMSM